MSSSTLPFFIEVLVKSYEEIKEAISTITKYRNYIEKLKTSIDNEEQLLPDYPSDLTEEDELQNFFKEIKDKLNALDIPESVINSDSSFESFTYPIQNIENANHNRQQMHNLVANYFDSEGNLKKFLDIYNTLNEQKLYFKEIISVTYELMKKVLQLSEKPGLNTTHRSILVTKYFYLENLRRTKLKVIYNLLKEKTKEINQLYEKSKNKLSILNSSLETLLNGEISSLNSFEKILNDEMQKIKDEAFYILDDQKDLIEKDKSLAEKQKQLKEDIIKLQSDQNSLFVILQKREIELEKIKQRLANYSYNKCPNRKSLADCSHQDRIDKYWGEVELMKKEISELEEEIKLIKNKIESPSNYEFNIDMIQHQLDTISHLRFELKIDMRSINYRREQLMTKFSSVQDNFSALNNLIGENRKEFERLLDYQ